MEKILLQTTANHSIFELHDMNRLTVSDGAYEPRKDLITSMKASGFLPVHPIICTKQPGGKLLVIDGHNRLITAKFLGIPVFYMAYPKEAGMSPIGFSSGQKQWTGTAKGIAYASEKPDYAEVVQFHADTGIPLMQCFSLFHGEVASSGNAAIVVTTGVFVIKDRTAPYVVASIIKALSSHCNFATSRNFVSAVSKAIFAEGFMPSKMISQIHKNPEVLEKKRSLDDYVGLLDLVYNRRCKTEHLHLQIEIDKAMRKRCVFNK